MEGQAMRHKRIETDRQAGGERERQISRLTDRDREKGGEDDMMKKGRNGE